MTPRHRRVPTTRLTLDYYRSRGWRVAYVQRTVKQGPITRSFDAWHFADHLMFPDPDRMREGTATLKAVNSCAVSDIGPHVKKVLLNARAWEFLRVSPLHQIVIAGWKRSKERRTKYLSKFRTITLEDFDEAMKPGVSCPLKLKPPRARRLAPCPLLEGVEP